MRCKSCHKLIFADQWIHWYFKDLQIILTSKCTIPFQSKRLYWKQKLSCEKLHNYYCLHYTVYVWLYICIWIYVMWYRPQTQKVILTSQVRLISLSVYLVNAFITWHVYRTTYGATIESIDVSDFITYLDIQCNLTSASISILKVTVYTFFS